MKTLVPPLTPPAQFRENVLSPSKKTWRQKFAIDKLLKMNRREIKFGFLPADSVRRRCNDCQIVDWFRHRCQSAETVRSQPGWSRGATRPAKKRHSSSSRRQNTVRRGEIRLPPAIKKQIALLVLEDRSYYKKNHNKLLVKRKSYFTYIFKGRTCRSGESESN